MNFGDIIAAHRKQQKITQQELANKLGYKSSLQVSRWEQGQALPSFDTGLHLCRILGIENPLQEFGYISRTLNDEGQRLVNDFASTLISSGVYRPVSPQEVRTLPLYVVRASAGPGVPIDSWVPFEEIEVDTSVPSSADCAIMIGGNSMEPRIIDGQTIYVHQQQNIDPGQVGIFFLNGAPLCKKFCTYNGSPELHSYNSAYPPIQISEQDSLRVFGKVIG